MVVLFFVVDFGLPLEDGNARLMTAFLLYLAARGFVQLLIGLRLEGLGVPFSHHYIILAGTTYDVDRARSLRELILEALPEARLTEAMTSEDAKGSGRLYRNALLILDSREEPDVVARRMKELEERAGRIHTPGGEVALDLGRYGVPSDSLRFAVEMHRNSSAANVALTEDGRLVAVNATTAVELPSLPAEKTIESVHGKDFGDLKSLPSDYIRATTTSKRAEIAAQEIYRLRDSRTAVLSGETDQPFADGQALRIAVQGLDAAERSLTERFIGTTDTITYVRLIRPLDVVEGQQVALRFSEREGLLSSDDLRGEPIYLETKITERAPELTERDQKKKEKQLRKGVVYVVPGSADIRLLYRGSRIAGGSFPIAQLGSLEALEGGLFTDKRMETSVRFDPATGAILKVDSRPRQ